MAEKEALVSDKKDGSTTDGKVPLDGAARVQAKRERLEMFYGIMSILYFVTGTVVFNFVEGWNPLECTIYTLSVLTGIGYGHIAPSTSPGKLFSALFTLLGMVLFASIAGQILDFMTQGEISAVLEAVAETSAADQDGGRKSYHAKQQAKKKTNFLVGCFNLSVLSLASVTSMIFYFGETPVNAIYLSSISVLRLDSICLLDGVECGPAGTGSLVFTIFWYVATYSIIGHFLLSASSYLGVDPDACLSKVQVLTEQRMERMDIDNDGKVSRSEFLRDRLIQDGLCTENAVDAILRNFDALDANRSGMLGKRDMA